MIGDPFGIAHWRERALEAERKLKASADAAEQLRAERDRRIDTCDLGAVAQFLDDLGEESLASSVRSAMHHVADAEAALAAAKADAAKTAAAVVAAGFRIAPDYHGAGTLWCIRCGRDSGLHWGDCEKQTDSRRTRDELARYASALRGIIAVASLEVSSSRSMNLARMHHIKRLASRALEDR